MPRLPALLLLLVVTGGPAKAGAVYKCSGTRGQLTYQDAPCTKAQQQQTLQLTDEASIPPPSTSAAAAPTSTIVTDEHTATPPAVPSVPLTKLYRCMRAVDGGAYVSSNGHPPPFLAPLGMLGALPMSLSQTYGPPGGAGISAPEANRGRLTAGLVANNYVWVQDQCRPLSVPEICRALRDEFDENGHKLQHAFKSDQPPLLRRDAALRAQLTNC